MQRSKAPTPIKEHQLDSKIDLIGKSASAGAGAQRQ
ncbi:hypothetical protein T07_6180 [Trichinella nelsoni]|uniref:Uncharacterized protein n=1 Tax=Trichinella nelsoni TaxID=6336 RepID=A0A0V0RAK9_9BILA|nr:hypothetical protein T07_6180 [Trichinella nelsoni]